MKSFSYHFLFSLKKALPKEVKKHSQTTTQYVTTVFLNHKKRIHFLRIPIGEKYKVFPEGFLADRVLPTPPAKFYMTCNHASGERGGGVYPGLFLIKEWTRMPVYPPPPSAGLGSIYMYIAYSSHGNFIQDPGQTR